MADRIRIENYKDIAEYARAHEYVIARMIEAKYTGIIEERITIKFMLKGIKKYPVLQHAAIQCSINPKSRITDLENMSVLVHNAIGITKAATNSSSDYPIWPTEKQASGNAQATDATIYDRRNKVAATGTYCRYHASNSSLMTHKDEECRIVHTLATDETNPQCTKEKVSINTGSSQDTASIM